MGDFFSSILSLFLKNLVALHSVWAGSTDRSIRSFSYNETKKPQPAAFWLPVFVSARCGGHCAALRPGMEKAPCRSLCTALFRWGEKKMGERKKRIGKFAAAGRLPAADGR